MRRAIIRVVMFFACLVSGAAVNAQEEGAPLIPEEVRIAVLAYDDPALVAAQLAPLVGAIEYQLKDVDIALEVLDYDELEQVAEGNQASIILTNPYHYLRLRDSDRLAAAFATIYRASPNGDIASFGGTIVTRAERDDIVDLADLYGADIVIGDERSAGGYALPLGVIASAGIDRNDLNIRALGSEGAALREVLEGSADVAFVRSSLMETLAARGELAEGQLKVLNRQRLGDYPFAVSTPLHPEWPLVAVGSTSPRLLSRLLGVSLLRPGKTAVNITGALAGLHTASEYTSLENTLRALLLPPYDSPPEISYVDVWRAHTPLIVVSLLALVVVAGLLLMLTERNRRLRHLWRDLRQSIAAQEEDQRKLADLNRHFELFLDRTTDFIYFKDASRRFIFASGAMAKLTGHTDRYQMEGKTDQDVFPPELAKEYFAQESELFESRQPLVDQRQRFRRLDGSMGWVSTYKWPVTSPDGDEVLGLIGISRDVTDLHDHERQLERAAHYDGLTGLPNRSLLFDRMEQAMAAVKRRGTELAVVYIDLDRFKSINDDYGHATGDTVLVRVAQTMVDCLRRSDTVARIGGDEFVVVLADLSSRKECLTLLDRLLLSIAEPVVMDDLTLDVTASAGLAFYDGEMDTGADRLLRQADQAMYRAKESGRNRYRLIDEQQDVELRAFSEDFKDAIRRSEFELHYQPVVDMASGDIIGAEALLRWRRGEDSILLPDEFLPMVFGHPLALDLERWVLREALEQQSRWREQGLHLRLHVNVTASDISQPEFAGHLAQQIDDTIGRDADCLTLEILESAAVADVQTVNNVIAQCGDLGVQFALDDFGTGYSSLSHIKDLRAKCVKIDKRFVQSMYASYDDFSLLAAILAMARAFDRDVVAEGVETLEQGYMLLRLGCRVAQGFVIARPMPAADFEKWSAQWVPDPLWQEADSASSAVISEGWSTGRAAWLEQKQRLSQSG